MSPKPVHIAQISDLHVKPPGSLAYGKVDTAKALERCIASLNDFDPAPDFVVISGDLADTPTSEEYQYLKRLLAPPAEPSLRVDRRGAWLGVSWLPVDEADSYVVARGEIGDWASHRVEPGGGSCDTAGEVQLFDPDDLRDSINRYYLVAGRNALGEGPLGVRRPDPSAPPGVGPPRPPRVPTAACP